MLINVPYQFRKWAVEQYMATHPSDSLIIDGGVLKSPAAASGASKQATEQAEAMKAAAAAMTAAASATTAQRKQETAEPLDMTALLQDLVASGKVEAAALFRKDGTVLASALPEGISAPTIAAFSSKELFAADAAASELNAGRVTSISGVCNDDTVLFHVFGSNMLLGKIPKDADRAFAAGALINVSAKLRELSQKQQQKK